jgi:hypothetical protein
MYRIDDTLAVLLLEAFPEDFTRYEKPAPPPAKAGWSNAVFISSGRRNITVRDGAETYWFTGPPEKISEFEKNLPANAGKCPDAVRNEYAAKYTPYVSQDGTS